MIKNGLQPRFAEVGKIKLGGKGEIRKGSKGDFQLPTRFEHFVITTTERDKESGNFRQNAELMKKLAENGKPLEIPIRLPFDDIDLNFYTSFQMYKGNKCICHGDGIEATRTGKDGIPKTVKCDPSTCEFLQPDDKGATLCKPSGILSCHIPMSMEVGGVYRFRTHSWNTVSAILAALQYFSENTNGVLQGLPLKLKFLKKATQEHGNVNIVTIVLDVADMMEMRKLALLEFENRLHLGIDMKKIQNEAREIGYLREVLDSDEPEDVQTEFYNEIEIDAVEDTEKGESADDVSAALDEKQEKTVAKSEQGSLL